MVADVPVGVLLSGGLDSSLVVALLARQGQRGLPTFSIGFESVGGREGDEFRYSDVIAREFGTDHHQIQIAAADLLPPLEAAVAAMSEPMVSHDCVAFYLLSQEVARAPQGRAVRPGRRRGLRRLPLVPAAGRRRPGTARSRRTRRPSSTGTRPAWRGSLDPAHLAPTATRAGTSSPHTSRRPARRPRSTPACASTPQIMLVDDPVKRVDNMTMAHGLEARVPFLDHELVELAAACPPELKLAQGGKGVLKEIGRRVLPHEVIDRPKGYFPVPGITHLEGKVLDRVRDALQRAGRPGPRAVPRRVRRTTAADPNGELTPLRGNKLWQLGLLEMWLQTHGIE